METPDLKQLMCNVDMWKKKGSLSVYLNKTKSAEIKDELHVWSDFNAKVIREEGKTNVYDD